MFVTTDLTLNSPNLGGSSVSMENVLNLPDTANRGYLEGFWRPARRHQLSLSYSALNRTSSGVGLERDLNWGGTVYKAGVIAVPRMDSKTLSAVYRFAVYKNANVELGPSVGAGYLWVTAGLSAVVAATASPQGATTTTIDREGNGDTPIGDIGGFVNWWAASRVYVRSDLRYIRIKPSDNTEESVTEARASLTYYPWRHLGFGGQYTYDKFRVDRSIVSTKLGGSYRYSGFQILASAPF